MSVKMAGHQAIELFRAEWHAQRVAANKGPLRYSLPGHVEHACALIQSGFASSQTLGEKAGAAGHIQNRSKAQRGEFALKDCELFWPAGTNPPREETGAKVEVVVLGGAPVVIGSFGLSHCFSFQQWQRAPLGDPACIKGHIFVDSFLKPRIY